MLTLLKIIISYSPGNRVGADDGGQQMSRKYISSGTCGRNKLAQPYNRVASITLNKCEKLLLLLRM